MVTEAAAPKQQKKMVNWASIRADFPILDQKVHGQPLIYFDNAATTQKPRAVLDALRYYYEHDNANVHRGIHELSNRATAAFEAAGARAAKFINARSADEIIFTRGTTEGITPVAQAWGSKNIKTGDQVSRRPPRPRQQPPTVTRASCPRFCVSCFVFHVSRVHHGP